MFARRAGLFEVGGIDRYTSVIDKLIRAHERGSIASITSKIFYQLSTRDISFIASGMDIAIYNLNLKAGRALPTMQDRICENSDTSRDELTTSEAIIAKYAELYTQIDYQDIQKWNSLFREYHDTQTLIGKFMSASLLFKIEIKNLKLEADKENTHPSLMGL